VSKKLSLEEVEKELELKNPTISVGKDYDGSTKKCTIVCNSCGYKWQQVPSMYIHLKNGLYPTCRKCYYKKISLIHKDSCDTYKQKLKDKKLNIRLLSAYTKSIDKGDFLCTVYNKKFRATFSYVLHRGERACPYCQGDMRKSESHTFEQAIESLNKHNPFGFSLVKSSYVQVTKNADFKCPNCNKVFTSTIASIKRGQHCPNCDKGESYGESYIRNFLDINKIEYKQEYSFETPYSKGRQRMDFYLPKYRLCIEFQGNQHYNKNNSWYSKSGVERDKAKLRWCKEHGIAIAYIYHTYDVFKCLSLYIKRLKRLPDDYNLLLKGQPLEIVSYLRSGHKLIEAMKKFDLSDKIISRYIRESGYKSYFDMLRQDKLDKNNLTYEEVIIWLKHNHFANVKKELGITKKHIITHIFHNPEYPYSNCQDIKIEAIHSQELIDYRKNHTKRETERYFMTDYQTLDKELGKNMW